MLDHERGSAAVIATRHRMIRTATDVGVWVVDVGGTTNSTATLLRLDDVDDHTVLATVQLPALAHAVAGLEEGLIVAVPGQTVEVAANGSDRRIAAGPAIASNGTQVAWLICEPDLACAVAVGTVDEPDLARWQLAPSDAPDDIATSSAVFSLDGKLLAVPLHRGAAANRGVAGSDMDVVVIIIDTRTGTERQRIAVGIDRFFTPLAWSPDSKWLAVGTGRTIRMWSVAFGEVVDLDDVDFGTSVRGLILQ